MRIERRRVLSGLAGAAGACLAAPELAAASARAAGPLARGSGEMPYLTRPPIDRQRAAEVLQRANLDGLVVSDPINVYYLTGLDSTIFLRSVMMDRGVYAVLARDARAPTALVLNSFNYYYGYSNIHVDPGVAVYQYNQARPADDRDASNTAGNLGTGLPRQHDGDLAILRDRQQEPLDVIEAERERRTRAQGEAHGCARSRNEALARALADLGLAAGRVAVDAPQGCESWNALQALAPKATFQPGDALLSTLRLVKSTQELAMMRYAARANAEAAHAACRAVRAGATYRDLRSTFFAEAARRGGIGAWITVDRVSADGYHATFRRGQAFMIDAVSTYGGYHGDYGRTVFVGEPSRHMRRHTRAIGQAWGDVRERLRPGLRFSEIQAIGQQALEKNGFDTAVRITPHSVGLLHTDARGIGDIALEKGMVISVDFPVMDAGIGGSAHLEDLTLITADGSECLNDARDPIITV
jgi:Xaa-Pro aminopeptidase